jgi:hypothetical protein
LDGRTIVSNAASRRSIDESPATAFFDAVRFHQFPIGTYWQLVHKIARYRGHVVTQIGGNQRAPAAPPQARRPADREVKPLTVINECLPGSGDPISSARLG